MRGPRQYRRREVEAVIKVEKIREAIRGRRPEAIQEGGGRGGYKSKDKSGRPSERGTPIQYRRAEAKAIIKVERIKEAIGGGRPDTIQKVGVRRGYKSRENQGGHHRGGPRQYKRWEVEAVIKGKITAKVNNKVKNMGPRVSHWRPKSLQGYPRRGSENEVAKKTLQGGKKHCKRVQNETTKSQGWW